MPAAHLHRGLVALSASAVAVVYMAGYMQTRSADAARGVAVAPLSVAKITSTATPATLALARYTDGTYTGQGSSRRGGVTVSVVVQQGRIASVTIASSTLQYPLRDIAGLPAQVVQRQSAEVDTVSRATYSSQAFRGAVAGALAKAV